MTNELSGPRLDEHHLILSAERLSMALGAGTVGVWDADMQAGVIYGDTNMARTYGIDPALARSGVPRGFYISLMHPEDIDRVRAELERSLTGDPNYSSEHRIITTAGEVRWVLVRGRLVRDAAGAPLRFPGISIDITARKLEEARQAFLLDLEDALRSLSDPQALLDTAVARLGRHLGANRVGYGQVQPDDATIELQTSYADGVAPVVGAYPLAAFGAPTIAAHREGRRMVRDDVAADPLEPMATWEALEIRSFASVPLVREGRFRASLFVNFRQPHAWSCADLALLDDVAGRIWDALERARAEAELRATNENLERLVAARTAALQANEARLRAIFETSHQLQGLLALDGTILDANAASLAVIDASFADVIGEKFWQSPWFRDTPGMPSRVRAAVAAAAAGTAVREEIVLQLPTGPRSFDFAVRPIRNDAGAIIAVVPEAVETTGWRRAEEALRQSQKMEAVGQLTGGLAHDFNNLLAGITGSLELLQRRVAQGRIADLERYIAAAQGAARRAASLTHRMLAFSRRQTLDPRPTDLNQLVDGMADLLRRTVGPEIAITVPAGDAIWPTLVDANQLENVLLNLCINARDAMPDGGRLTIETGTIELDDAGAAALEVAPGAYVWLCVTDTGIGMAPEVVARAFDPFFTTKPIGQGTGLGLSMTYGFVRQSGGQVRIASQPGAGTGVTLYLPRSPTLAASETLDRQPPVEVPPAHGETVLIVDDEPAVRMLVCDVLEDLGYHTIGAEDGAAALAVLRSNQRIDLLVTDVGLPGGINGRQVADAGRSLRPGLKVLFITGYAESAVMGHERLESGMFVLTKPFAIEALGVRVRAIIEES